MALVTSSLMRKQSLDDSKVPLHVKVTFGGPPLSSYKWSGMTPTNKQKSRYPFMFGHLDGLYSNSIYKVWLGAHLVRLPLEGSIIYNDFRDYPTGYAW